MRTIHMNGEVPDDTVPSPLGYSIGRWEGSTLIIETSHVDYPILDDSGTPVIVTDPMYLAEPAIWDAVWAWEPGVTEISPFECAVR